MVWQYKGTLNFLHSMFTTFLAGIDYTYTKFGKFSPEGHLNRVNPNLLDPSSKIFLEDLQDQLRSLRVKKHSNIRTNFYLKTRSGFFKMIYK